MRVSGILSSTLFLISTTCAGRSPFYFNFPESTCDAIDGDFISNFSLPKVPLREHNDSQSGSNHDRIVEKSPSRPWTRDPECLRDEETGDKYCVYTSDKFANGRGISFFTSPSIAKRVEGLPAFIRKDLFDGVNDVKDVPWEIKIVPGRGNGLYATRVLHRGDKILAGTPAGVYQSDAFFPDYPIGYKYLRKTYEHLPNATKEVFLRMATHTPGDMVMERINTNAFAGNFEGAPHFLLYPETALMNHDCRPNSMYHLDHSTLIHSTYASRTILPGEEITITYINILRSRAIRQQMLQTTWGFQCTCSICSGSVADIRISDAHLARINELQGFLIDWTEKSIATPRMAEELLLLYEQEHLHAAKGMGHMFAALAHNAAGAASRAKKHAELALDAGVVSDGSKEEDERSMTQLKEFPTGHWSYMARVQG